MTFDMENVNSKDMPPDTFSVVKGNDLLIMPGQTLMSGGSSNTNNNNDGGGGFGWGRRLFGGGSFSNISNKVSQPSQQTQQ